MQIPLPFEPRPEFYTREEFAVTNSNKNAMGWVEKWPNWHAPGLILYGPSGCGKTHLAHIWQQKSQAVFITQICFPLPHPFIILDGITFDDESLFHLYNAVHEQQGSFLMTASQSPQSWNFSLKDTESRFLSLPAAAMDEPDDDLLKIIIQKYFTRHQLTLTHRILSYLLTHGPRSFIEIQHLCHALNMRSLIQKHPITIHLIRQSLAEIHAVSFERNS